MDYWRGYMNWPLDEGWSCETCGNRILIWGLIHGICRCDTCHTEYSMRDSSQDDNLVVTIPICILKPEYKQHVKSGWKLFHNPISEWNDDQWEQALASILVGKKV